MKNTTCILAIFFGVACGSGALAQANKPLQQPTIAETLNSWITHTETLVLAVADAMPEDKYAFAPSSTSGDFNGVRTFAQQVKHLAANNHRMATLILGGKPSADMDNENGPDSVVTKTGIMEYAKGSFDALHKAVATIDEMNVVQPIASPSLWQKTRLSFAVDAVAHSMDHFGQLVEYLRMNGIIPPESRPKKSQEIKADRPARLAAVSQTGAAGEHADQAAVLDAPREKHAMQIFLKIVENRVVTAAEAMPANKYVFVPTEGEFKGVRSFGQQVKHLAATNHILAAAALDEAVPSDAGDEMGPETVRTKVEILEYLRASFAHLGKAINAIDNKNATVKTSPISPLQGTAPTRLALAVEALIHAFDHYGQMVEYLRMNGVVPPASRS